MMTKTIATFSATLLTCSLAGVLAGCSTTSQEKASWAYTGSNGPANWGDLADCEDCSQGTEQSPIDIPAGTHKHQADIAFNYHPTALNILNNGHAIQVRYDAGSSIRVEGKTYNLLQFHFHALSEHTLAGKHSDMEVHFVHQSADREYAVVGVMMNRGTTNAAYQSVSTHAPTKKGAQTIASTTLNAIDFLPADKSYYRYDGSFTTPPCTEGVKWFLMATPVELSDAQISSFKAIYDNNYRPVQPFNTRVFH